MEIKAALDGKVITARTHGDMGNSVSIGIHASEACEALGIHLPFWMKQPFKAPHELLKLAIDAQKASKISKEKLLTFAKVLDHFAIKLGDSPAGSQYYQNQIK